MEIIIGIWVLITVFVIYANLSRKNNDKIAKLQNEKNELTKRLLELKTAKKDELIQSLESNRIYDKFDRKNSKWICGKCGNENYIIYDKCQNCNKPFEENSETDNIAKAEPVKKYERDKNSVQTIVNENVRRSLFELPDGFVCTSEFERAFDSMENSNECLFITGKAGTGKSTLITYFRITDPAIYIQTFAA
jgi:DNA replication protein DnaC